MVIPEKVCESIWKHSKPYLDEPVPSREEFGRILNAIAWDNKDDGWGMSYKGGGKNVVAPDGTPIAEDVLHKMPENLLFDIFTGADVGLRLKPSCGGDIGPPTSADRTFVKPTNPGNTVPDPEVPPMPEKPVVECKFAPCTDRSSEVLSKINLLGARLDVIVSDVKSLRGRIEELAVHNDEVIVNESQGVSDRVIAWLKSNRVSAKLW